ncbi:MAG TPA: type II toxin-antitoxin system prevent-host-death family antitoxin [Candidatus Nitrosotalea sp.]|nr:type II toxin-antitoxin system prevent-host-death family antitoxin [Candidatus Nitrosotalea sp.]
MSEVSIRDLRNHGGEVIDRVTAGEEITVTRDGKPVAELRPLASRRLSAETLLRRWARLPAVDAARLRADIDSIVDTSV